MYLFMIFITFKSMVPYSLTKYYNANYLSISGVLRPPILIIYSNQLGKVYLPFKIQSICMQHMHLHGSAHVV